MVIRNQNCPQCVTYFILWLDCLIFLWKHRIVWNQTVQGTYWFCSVNNTLRKCRSVVGFVLLYCEYPVLFSMSLFFFCSFSFGHCIVCPLIYGFWFHLWYIQSVLWSVVVMCILSSLYSIFSRNLIHCVHGESRPIQ